MRISIGIEDVEDLIADIDVALEAVAAATAATAATAAAEVNA